MQQDLINRLQEDGKEAIAPWVYEHAVNAWLARKTPAAAKELKKALAALPIGYDPRTVQPALSGWIDENS